MTGLDRRIALLQPEAVFKELGTQAITYKSLLEPGKPSSFHWKWAPRYIGLPKKMWNTKPTILKEDDGEEARRSDIGKPKRRHRKKTEVRRIAWQRARGIGQGTSPRRVKWRIRGKTERFKIRFKHPRKDSEGGPEEPNREERVEESGRASLDSQNPP